MKDKVNEKIEKKHEHKFIARPEWLGIGCMCGASRFATRFGLAEHNPKTDKTIRVSDGKILYEPK